MDDNRKPIFFRLYFFVTILALAGYFSASALPADNQAEHKRNLSRILDSLEVEKQVKKRNGEAFTDLEERTARIRDSLAVLKQQIAHGITQPPAPPRPASITSSLKSLSLQAIIKPRSIFDWIILVVGMFAVISGAILVVGVLKASSERHSRKKAPSAPAAQQFPTRTAMPPVKEEWPEMQTVRDTFEDTRLRTRARFDNAESPEPAVLRQEPVLPQQPPTPSSSPGNDSSINSKIIQAARDGLDTQEISRRFHISADQVALILKVARKR